MTLPMLRPTKHPKTGVYRIRSRVPKGLQGIIGSAERVISLVTKSPEEAKRRAPAAERKIAEAFAAARATLEPARRLTHREIMALCGELHRETVGHWRMTRALRKIGRLTPISSTTSLSAARQPRTR